jgi:hypothetical protein
VLRCKIISRHSNSNTAGIAVFVRITTAQLLIKKKLELLLAMKEEERK